MAIFVTHNANEVLRSSRKLHYDLTAVSMQSCKLAAREVQLAIRDKLPQYRTPAGKFEGYASTGALRRAVSVTVPRKTREGWQAEVYMMPDKTQKYQAIHEYGGIIRAKRAPYLVFNVKGRWVRVKQVRIRQKRYWRGVQPGDVAVKIRQRTEDLVRTIK